MKEKILFYKKKIGEYLDIAWNWIWYTIYLAILTALILFFSAIMASIMDTIVWWFGIIFMYAIPIALVFSFIYLKKKKKAVNLIQKIEYVFSKQCFEEVWFRMNSKGSLNSWIFQLEKLFDKPLDFVDRWFVVSNLYPNFYTEFESWEKFTFEEALDSLPQEIDVYNQVLGWYYEQNRWYNWKFEYTRFNYLLIRTLFDFTQAYWYNPQQIRDAKRKYGVEETSKWLKFKIYIELFCYKNSEAIRNWDPTIFSTLIDTFYVWKDVASVIVNNEYKVPFILDWNVKCWKWEIETLKQRYNELKDAIYNVSKLWKDERKAYYQKIREFNSDALRFAKEMTNHFKWKQKEITQKMFKHPYIYNWFKDSYFTP